MFNSDRQTLASLIDFQGRTVYRTRVISLKFNFFIHLPFVFNTAWYFKNLACVIHFSEKFKDICLVIPKYALLSLLCLPKSRNWFNVSV